MKQNTHKQFDPVLRKMHENFFASSSHGFRHSLAFFCIHVCVCVCVCVCVRVLFCSLSSVWKCISLFTAWGLISCRSCWLVPLTSGLKRERERERERERQAGRQAGRQTEKNRTEQNRGYSGTFHFKHDPWDLTLKIWGDHSAVCAVFALDSAVMHLLWLYLFKALAMLVFPSLPLSLAHCLCVCSAWTDLTAAASLTISISRF